MLDLLSEMSIVACTELHVTSVGAPSVTIRDVEDKPSLCDPKGREEKGSTAATERN